MPARRDARARLGVFLAYASRSGYTLLDRELSLPAVWTDDQERCRNAEIPDACAFVTQPALARQMLERTRTAGVAVAWITGDASYGDDRALRQYIEEHRQAYLLAVSGKASVWLQHQQRRITTLLRALPAEGWERLSAGMGSKGPRWYAWRRLEASAPAQERWKRWVLLRRSIMEPTEVTASVHGASYRRGFRRGKPSLRSSPGGGERVFRRRPGQGCNNPIHQDNYNGSTKNNSSPLSVMA